MILLLYNSYSKKTFSEKTMVYKQVSCQIIHLLWNKIRIRGNILRILAKDCFFISRSGSPWTNFANRSWLIFISLIILKSITINNMPLNNLLFDFQVAQKKIIKKNLTV